MRIVVIGCSGAGKTTLARQLAARFDIPCIELDAINWQAGWRDLNRYDPREFARRIERAIAPDAWVAEGNYRAIRSLLWRRATHLVWLDHDIRLVMARLILRSIHRAVAPTELWPGTGNRESWRGWRDPDHPIRDTWTNWRRQRFENAADLAAPDHAHLTVFRLRRPAEVRRLVKALAASRSDGVASVSPDGLAPSHGPRVVPLGR